MTYAVRFEHVTKRYPRGWSEEEGPRYASLRHDVASIGRRLTGRSGRSQAHGTLALEDVSFEVEEGESFALIGPNGAGKSTALKMISRISYPTSGKVRIRGRVAALMEVGSGVHPELTGRENIWLYGQILGLRKADIRRRFDEIVEFAELGHAIDTPVKFFSSGMQLRLGFSIAAHLEPDIFVVDEALAVGDARFQAKCIELMTRLIREGRTLLFVSHNPVMIEAVCRQGAWLVNGALKSTGPIRDVLGDYISSVDAGLLSVVGDASIGGRGVDFLGLSLRDDDGVERYSFEPGEGFTFEVRLHAHQRIEQSRLSIGISDGRQGPLVLLSMLEGDSSADLSPGQNLVRCRLRSLPLAPRTYEVWVNVRESTGVADIVDWTRVGAFRVRTHDGEVSGPGGFSLGWSSGPVRVSHEWSVDRHVEGDTGVGDVDDP